MTSFLIIISEPILLIVSLDQISSTFTNHRSSTTDAQDIIRPLRPFNPTSPTSIMPFVLDNYNDTMDVQQTKSQDYHTSANAFSSPTATHNSSDCRKDAARHASPQPENNAETQAQSFNSTNGNESEYYDYDEEEEYDDDEE
jgi:hypothetical protein